VSGGCLSMAEQSRFGAILKRYRVAAGLSQEALAARASLSARAISDLERGLHRTPHPGTIDLLATALALTPDQRAVLLAEAHPPAPLYAAEPPSPRRLPLAPTALIGRDQERRHARTLLIEQGCRLLTLIGPGGAGKTRLALDIAESLTTEFADGVIFVDLAPVRSAHLLNAALAQALGLRERRSRAPAESAVYTELREKRVLLLLDNFEHMVASSPAIASLLAHCPKIAILVTSRTRLGLRSEHLLPVAPLALDAAVEMFCERAHAVRPDRDSPREQVAAICQRVDCLPLAIELAAVQTRLLPLAQLLDYLTHRLALLRGGASDLPARQQTMEDTIAWSYELLGDAQQRCFRALGVFVGGWTLDAAHAICWDADSSDSATSTTTTDTLLTLAALVDASLIQADEMANGTVRFHMLELIRDYALARLEESREAHACHLRHARHFAQTADAISRVGPTSLPHGVGLTDELPNARAALEWADQVGEAALGLRLASFGRLWLLIGQSSEALLWQERTLALDERTPIQEGDATRLVLRAERLYGFGRTLLGVGEYDRAEAQAHAALELALRLGDDGVTSNTYMTIGMIAHARGEYDTAASALTAAYERTPAIDQTGQRHRVESLLADTERRRGNLTTAAALLEHALADAEALGNTWDTARVTTMQGLVACQQAHYSEATRYFVKALTLFRPFGSPRFSAWCLEGFAAVLSAQGAQMWVARLCGAATNLRTQAQAPAPTAEQEAIDILLATARARLGEQAFADAWRAGRALTLDAVIEEALAEGVRRLNPDDA
jgi:predicted ATPase/DNA-binding XRE family transcriptional regulator